MTDAAKEILRRAFGTGEWSMGNGQCPNCHGAHAGWYGHPCFLTPDTIGHQADCIRVAALRELGQTPLMIGTFVPTAEQEAAAQVQISYRRALWNRPSLRTGPATEYCGCTMRDGDPIKRESCAIHHPT